MKAWSPASTESRALRAGSSIAITLQVCRLDEVGGGLAAATIVSTAPVGIAPSTKRRTERCESNMSSVWFQSAASIPAACSGAP